MESPDAGASPDATKVLVMITDGDPSDGDVSGILKEYNDKNIIRFVIVVSYDLICLNTLSYLSNRYISVDRYISSAKTITSGMPQGSVLRTVLFTTMQMIHSNPSQRRSPNTK